MKNSFNPEAFAEQLINIYFPENPNKKKDKK